MNYTKLLFLTLAVNNLNAQVGDSHFKKVVEFTENHFTRYSIPMEVPFDSLDNMDLAESIPYTSTVKVKIMVDYHNNVTVEKNYSPGYTGISRYDGISKSISGPDGLQLFDEIGLEVVVDDDSPSTQNSSIPISNDLLSNLGFEQTVTNPTNDQLLALSQLGLSAYSADNNRLYVVNGELNLISDAENNSTEVRVFKANQLHYSEEKHLSEIANGRSILTKKVSKSFKAIKSGFLMELADIVLYSNYRIIENGIISYEQTPSIDQDLLNLQSRNSGISNYEKVKPFNRLLELRNNGNSNFIVELPTLKEGNSELTLFTLDGKPIWRISTIDGPNMNIDLSELIPGSYFLHYTDKLGRISKQIINF